MDSKFYVSYEAARLLKEKGYNNYSTVYDCSVEGNILLNQRPMYGEWAGDKDVYPCPTKAEAIDWLEGKNLTITIDWIRFNEQRRWCYGICNNETCDWEGSRYEYITRLEAEDAAIIKALELL
jgi:hypothetical protein